MDIGDGDEDEEQEMTSLDLIERGSPLTFLSRYNDSDDGAVLKIIASMTKKMVNGRPQYRGLTAEDMPELAKRVGEEVGYNVQEYYVTRLLNDLERGTYTNPLMISARRYNAAYDEAVDSVDYTEAEDYESDDEDDEPEEEGEEENVWIGVYDLANLSEAHPKLYGLPQEEWINALNEHRKAVEVDVAKYGPVDQDEGLTILDEVLSSLFDKDVRNLPLDDVPPRDFLQEVSDKTGRKLQDSTLSMLYEYRETDEDALMLAYFDSLLTESPENAAKNPTYDRVVAFLEAGVEWMEMADVAKNVAGMEV